MKKLPILFLFLLPLLASCVEKQVYIVYFGEHKGDKSLHEIEEFHHSYLYGVKQTEEEAKASLLYSYKHSINGFSALLTPDEASKLSGIDIDITFMPLISMRGMILILNPLALTNSKCVFFFILHLIRHDDLL
ncbi:SUBTILISIN-LIKE PROTEASE SBT5.6 [Salix koriyanagi]|uniref:SUBTILISIN-LIKE PROTEASE SBT5.6 n=1 Tax=Salix koriyanagi TaxID=2511006 RepID=A0A9Q0ZBH6_9ROSI|nr:SUBTILISIN-LIKE PROTEASE SBT5.6 [Salix koriyanagi]